MPKDAPVDTAPRCDILIFTVVPSETKALKMASKELGLAYDKVEWRGFECRDLGVAGSSRVMTLETEMGPFGFDGAAARAIEAKTVTGAQALVGLGMAFGIDPADQKVGDVLVSTSILTYDDRQIRRSPSGEMEIGFPDRIRYKARAQMLTPLRQEAERRNWAGVRFGSLLSGGAAIHCAQYRDDLVQKLSPVLERLSPDPDERIIGGEMEACGLIASSDPKEPNWVVVKGISDFADENRDAVIEMNRPVACGNAARFLLAALRNFNPGA